MGTMVYISLHLVDCKTNKSIWQSEKIKFVKKGENRYFVLNKMVADMIPEERIMVGGSVGERKENEP